MDEYRTLIHQEEWYARNQGNKRTESELRAYRSLPWPMRLVAERNVPIAFVGCKCYFPDILFRQMKVVLEIDGDVHDEAERQQKDIERDRVFREHGYATIRIKNEDADFEVAFLERLIEGLKPLDEREHEGAATYIAMLRELTGRIYKECLNVHEA